MEKSAAQETMKILEAGINQAETYSNSTCPELGALLVARGFLEPQGLARLESLRSGNPQRLSRLVVDMGLISQDALCQLYSETLDLPIWDGNGEPMLDAGFPDGYLDYNRILALDTENGKILVIDDPEDDGLIDMLTRLFPESGLAITTTQKLSATLNALQAAEGGGTAARFHFHWKTSDT